MATVRVRDETTSGEILRELELQLTAEDTSVRELITARVHQEVRAHNAEPAPEAFQGLVQPSATEQELNGVKKGRRGRRRVDPGRQTDVAIAGFERGRILVLVDDKQVTDLDERVTLRAGSSVTFLKLVPLVGG